MSKFFILFKISSYCAGEKENFSLSLFFYLIMMTLGWFLYLPIAIKTGSWVLRKLVSKSFSTDIFKFGTILTKNLLKTSAIALSSEIVSSDSIIFSSSLGIIFFFLLKSDFHFPKKNFLFASMKTLWKRWKMLFISS